MANIIAIGGGGFGSEHGITPIHQEIINRTGKTNPHLVFIPTASADADKYIARMHQEFVETLGCTMDALLLIKEKPTLEDIAQRIKTADIIYVGGGNTLKMMNLWRKLGIDKLLMQAYAAGKVMCGPSAGSICWFAFGNSDSRKDNNPQAPLIKVRGLGLINALHCPHYDSETERKESLKAMMKKVHKLVAIAIDDCCALQIADDSFRILSTKPTANAYKVYWHKGVFYEEVIAKTSTFASLAELLRKK
jgi:dipeptidase E